MVNPKILVEGFRMYMGNKEIEVKVNTYKLLTYEINSYHHGLQIVDKVLCIKPISNEVPKETIPEPPKKKFKSTNSGPYIPFNLLQQGLL